MSAPFPVTQRGTEGHARVQGQMPDLLPGKQPQGRAPSLHPQFCPITHPSSRRDTASLLPLTTSAGTLPGTQAHHLAGMPPPSPRNRGGQFSQQWHHPSSVSPEPHHVACTPFPALQMVPPPSVRGSLLQAERAAGRAGPRVSHQAMAPPGRPGSA